MRKCIFCRDNYGWEGEPTLNCELREHEIYDSDEEDRKRIAAQRKRIRDEQRPKRKQSRRRSSVPYAPRQNAPSGMYSVAELVSLWGVSHSLIERWCRQGRFQGAKKLVTARTCPKWYIPVTAQHPRQPSTRSRKQT